MRIDDAHLETLDEYLQSCLRINADNIQEEYIRTPAVLAYWNHQYSQAIREYLEAKLQCRVMRAQLLPEIRMLIASTGGKVTEAQVEAAIDCNLDIINADRAMNEAEAKKNELYGVVDAVRSRRDMLVSLGATLRTEMQGDPVILDHVKAKRLKGE